MSKIDREKEKSRRLRRLAKQQQEVAELSQRDEEVAEEEDATVQEPLQVMEATSKVAEVRKDYPLAGDFVDMASMPMLDMGPTSFEELDALRQAQEQADEIQEVTWDVQDLVRNILRNPMLAPDEKAGKMQDVAAEFETRVSDAMSADALEKDMDLLQVEAMLAIEDRTRTSLQKAMEWSGEMLKATLNTKKRKQLSGSDFALPGKKKYPIHDKAHVRNALARAAQQIKAGGEGAADAKAALPAIHAAAKKFGIGTLEKSSIMIEKDAKGDWRWVGIPSNNFVDWQNDIISKAAQENYVAWLDENPDMAPVFMSWHTPGTERENPVDFWMEKDGALIMSGILTQAEAAALFKLQKTTDLGMSYQGFGSGVPDAQGQRVINNYYIYEVSDLPRDRAANPFTSLETLTKEVGMDKLEYLSGIMGSKEKAELFLKKTGQTQKQLKDAGITSKAVEEPETETKQVETQAPAPADAQALIAQLAKAMKDEFDFDGLNAFVAQAQEAMEKVEVMEGLVKELSKSKDDQLVEALTPPVTKFAWSQANRPSQSNSTKLKKGTQAAEDDEDEKLSKSQPGVPDGYWLSEITGTAPIPIEQ